MINITDKRKCCGCGSCVQSCAKKSITMQIDEEGFYYPRVDSTTCVDCGLCERVCPVINQSSDCLPIKCYAAKGKNFEIVKKSSSAGVFSLLAEKVINNGGVVFGARFDNNWDVEHSYTDSIDGINQFRSSKYVQSRIGNSYQEVRKFLLQGRQVLFTGTPCQVAGLKKFLRKDYENLICVDVICHGTPSPGIWRDYLRYLLSPRGQNKSVLSSIYLPLSEREASRIKEINFRDKRLGWKKYSFVLTSSQDGSRSEENSVLSSSRPLIKEKHYYNLFMIGFLKNIIIRPSCFACPARKGRSGSDLLLGDFWGIARKYPDFFSKDGVSMILAYTEKGNKLLRELNLEIKRIEYNDTKGNSNIESNEPIPSIRNVFFMNYQAKGIYTLVNYCKNQQKNPLLIILLNIKDKLKSFIQ